MHKWKKEHILLPFPSSEIPLGQTSKQYTTTVVQRTSTKLAGEQKRRNHEQRNFTCKLYLLGVKLTHPDHHAYG
jgi:hypothetical protein